MALIIQYLYTVHKAPGAGSVCSVFDESRGGEIVDAIRARKESTLQSSKSTGRGGVQNGESSVPLQSACWFKPSPFGSSNFCQCREVPAELLIAGADE